MNTVQSPSVKVRFWSWIKFLPLSLLTIVFSLNSILAYVADGATNGWKGILSSLSRLADTFYSNIFAPYDKYFWFSLFVRWVFFSILIIIGLIILLCFIHRSLTPLTSGISGFCLGLFFFTEISLVILFYGLISFVIIFISEMIQDFLQWFLNTPLIYCLVPLLVILAIITVVILYQLVKDLRSDMSWEGVLRGIFLIGVVVLVIWGIIQALRSPSITDWIISVVVVLTQIVLYTIGLIFLITGMVVLGRQFVDQFGSAKMTGSSTISMFDTGFNIGSALALSFLVVAAVPAYERFFYEALLNSPFEGFQILNITASLIPDDVLSTLHRLLAGSSLPVFDFFILFTVCLLSIASLLLSITHTIRIYRWRDIWTTANHRSALLMTVFGIIFMMTLMMSDSLAAEDK